MKEGEWWEEESAKFEQGVGEKDKNRDQKELYMEDLDQKHVVTE